MSSSTMVSRRGVLQSAALLVATPILMGAFPGVGQTTENVSSNFQTSGKSSADLPLLTKKRMLGKGKFSMEVSALGFGIMGANHNRGISPDKKEMIKMIRQAAEHGITFFDTAQVYGPLTNEELTGEALAPYRDKVRICTKFGYNIIAGKRTEELNSRPEHIRKTTEESLKRLRIEAIDLLYQHRFDPQVPAEDVAGTVRDLIREGKVKYFGMCEVGPETIRRAHAEQPITAIQSEYHLMWREPETSIFPVLEELGIGFVPFSPLNRGLLGGDITEYTRFDSGNDNRNSLPRFLGEALRNNLMFVEILNRFGRSRGITGAQAALGWLLYKEDWIVPIPGTTKLTHLEENIRAASLAVSSADWKELEDNLSKVKIEGERYPAAEQKKIQKN